MAPRLLASSRASSSTGGTPASTSKPRLFTCEDPHARRLIRLFLHYSSTKPCSNPIALHYKLQNPTNYLIMHEATMTSTESVVGD